jgi:hypothetical protein
MPSKLLARFEHAKLRDEVNQAIAKAVREDPSRETPLPPGWKPADWRHLRGLPVAGYGVTGATGGSVPHFDAPSLRRERRQR